MEFIYLADVKTKLIEFFFIKIGSLVAKDRKTKITKTD